MRSTAITRIAPEAVVVARGRKRAKDVTVAVVTVLNPATAARLSMAQDLGKPLRCAYRNGRVHIWTEEPR